MSNNSLEKKLRRITGSRVTEKLLTYALGRGLEFYDAPVVRQIVRDAEPEAHRWSSLILGIVESVPFQMRRADDAPLGSVEDP